ncbi:MAG: hypothetical protein J6P58_03400 [Oscillospiraceae bacterium]|nr:hypothetical protein [Oscillospiraceae bacterium]
MNNQKKKKGGFGSVLVVFLLIFLLPRLFELLESADFRYALWRLQRWMAQHGVHPGMLPLILVAAVVLILVVTAMLSSARKKRNADAAVQTKINSAGGRTSAAGTRPDPRNRTFTPPEPTCIVCDHTGEDHFLRDKAQRIAQLDEWLKNGLIEKNEYRVLKDRFERDL